MVRLKDIAAQAGVSVMTVSKALRDAPDISAATKARLRALADAKSVTPRLRLAPALMAAAVVLALGVLVFLRQPLSPAHTPSREVVASFAFPSVAPRASLLAYRAAANDGDAALLAMLDRDASTLLPTSSTLFNTTLP